MFPWALWDFNRARILLKVAVVLSPQSVSLSLRGIFSFLRAGEWRPYVRAEQEQGTEGPWDRGSLTRDVGLFSKLLKGLTDWFSWVCPEKPHSLVSLGLVEE